LSSLFNIEAEQSNFPELEGEEYEEGWVYFLPDPSRREESLVGNGVVYKSNDLEFLDRIQGNAEILYTYITKSGRPINDFSATVEVKDQVWEDLQTIEDCVDELANVNPDYKYVMATQGHSLSEIEEDNNCVFMSPKIRGVGSLTYSGNSELAINIWDQILRVEKTASDEDKRLVEARLCDKVRNGQEIDEEFSDYEWSIDEFPKEEKKIGLLEEKISEAGIDVIRQPGSTIPAFKLDLNVF